MKRTMKKILCLTLALIMTVPLLALGISADTATPSFGAEVVVGNLIKTVNFSDSAMWGTG